MTRSPCPDTVTTMISLEQRQPETPYDHIEANGTRFACVQLGAGSPVVFVHGGVSDITIWDPILDPVARSHRAIAYSRRWAWPNQPIPEGVADTLDIHARDLAAIIETLKLGAVDLVGNSWGGFVSLIVARDRPELVRRLVLQEPPVVTLFMGAPPGPSGLLKTLVSKPRVGIPLARMVFTGLAPTEALVKKGRAEESVQHFVRRVALGDVGYDELPGWVKEHMRLNIGTHIAQFQNRGGFIPFTARDARSITKPTLVMKGERSPEALKVLADELARLLPYARTIEIPKASHVMHVANPAATAKAITDFLAGS